MNKDIRKPVHIPNTFLAITAVALAAMGLYQLTHDSKSDAIMSFAGAGIFLSALNFSYPALPLWAKIVVTPVLLAPATLVLLLSFGLV
jgi:hypothetical protein